MRRFLAWTLGLLATLVVAVLLVLAFPPTGWIAGKVEQLVAERTGYTLDIGELDLDLLSGTPSATVSSVSLDGGALPDLLKAERAEVAIDLGAALGGEIIVDRAVVTGADVRLLRTADGTTSWTPGTVEEIADTAEEEAAEPDGGEFGLPTIRELRVEDTTLDVDDEITGAQASLDVEAFGSTLPGRTPLSVTADGTANAAPVRADLKLASALDEALSGGSVQLALDAAVGGLEVGLNGSVGDPAGLGDVDLALDVDIDSLDALETALGAELPAVAPASLAATLRTEGGGLVLVADGAVDGEPVRVALALDPEAPLVEALAGDVPVTLDLDAAVGGASVTLAGRVDDPAALGGVDLALEADVDSLAALETVLGTELPALAPAALSATVTSTDDGYDIVADGTVDGEPVRATLDLDASLDELRAGGPVELALDARVGGAELLLAGRVDELATLGGADLALEANVESLAAAEKLTGAELPEIDSATLTASVTSGADGQGLAVNADGSVDGESVEVSLDLDTSIEAALAGEPVALDLDATVGGASVRASGGVEDLRAFEGVDLELDADVDSLAALEKLTGSDLPEIDSATLSASVRSNADGEGYAVRADGEVDGERIDASLDLDRSIADVLAGESVNLDLDATVGGASVSASGRVDDIRTFEGGNLDLDVDIGSLAALEKVLNVDLPELEPASLTTTLRTEGDETVLEAEGTVGGEPASATLALGTPIADALAGEPVTLDLDASVGGTTLALSGSVEDPLALGGLDLELEADVASLDAIETLLGTELPALEPASLSATVRSEGERTVLEAEGTVDGAPVNATLAVESSVEGILAGGPVTLDLDAAVGGAALSLDGTVEDPATLSGIDLALDADVDSLDAIETLLGTELPALAPASLDATLLTEGDAYVVRRFDLAAAGSTLQGDVRVDPTTGPPTVYANLISRRLDADALLATLDAVGVDEAVEEAVGDDEAEDGLDDSGPILPSKPLAVDAVFGSAQGAVALRIDELVWESVPLASLDVRAELAPERVDLTLAEAALADGDVAGSLRLEPLDGASALDAKLDLELSRVRVARFVPDIELMDDLGGPLGGQVELWATGDSVAGLAGSLDGGVSLLMGRGQLDAVLVELAGIDLFQAIGDVLNPGEEEFRLRCAYASLLADAGVVSVDELVIDSEDTVFLARGTVDLGAETLDLALEPHPKDPSLLAANTGVAIGGTLVAPEFEVGNELPARAAAAAALAVVATPAAALLPFIGVGGGEDSGFCELEGALDGDAG